MSSSTSIADALSSSVRQAEGRCWRFVEAQHHVSTTKLTDTLAQQRRLEALIDQTKPAIPPECRDLHFLLATPFRYGAPYPNGSRFRRAGLTLGVFYGAQRERPLPPRLPTIGCCFLPSRRRRRGPQIQGNTPPSAPSMGSVVR